MKARVLAGTALSMVAAVGVASAQDSPRVLTSSSVSPLYSGTPDSCVRKALKVLAIRGYKLSARGDWGASGLYPRLSATVAVVCEIPGRIVVVGSYPADARNAGKAEVEEVAVGMGRTP